MEGRGTASTHPSDPILPTGLQDPEHAANLATDSDHVNGSQPFEYAMAAAQSMRTYPPNIAQEWMQADWPKWNQSICHELEQLEQMGAWELVDPPKDVNIFGSHFVFHYKLDVAGKVESCKVRLVAQGFSQQGVDYNETFSLMAKLSAICIIAALVAHNNWELEQTDIDGVYLNAPLMETIYMRQPRGY